MTLIELMNTDKAIQGNSLSAWHYRNIEEAHASASRDGAALLDGDGPSWFPVTSFA